MTSIIVFFYKTIKTSFIEVICSLEYSFDVNDVLIYPITWVKHVYLDKQKCEYVPIYDEQHRKMLSLSKEIWDRLIIMNGNCTLT